FNYRSNILGAWLNDSWPKYWDASNPAYPSQGEDGCAEKAKKSEHEMALNYISRLQALAPGASVVLTLVPWVRGCVARVQRIAGVLDLAFVAPGSGPWTYWGGGAHLDGPSARNFTTRFLAGLENLEQFKALQPQKQIAR